MGETPNTAVQNDLATRPAHTPGPFFFKRGRGVDPRDFIVVDSTGNTVAETNIALYQNEDEELDPSVRPISIEEAIANSHLFAASPELLDALKAIDKQLECPARNTNRGYRYAEATVISSDLRKQVKEAIAKAEGR